MIIRKKYILIVISCIVLSFPVLWLGPRLLSLYYQTKGGLILSEINYNYDPNVFQIGCNGNESNNINEAEVNKSIDYLHSAISNNPAINHANLLLGRAYCLIGDYHNAVKSYLAYIEKRPDNPLGYLELGFIYYLNEEPAVAKETWYAAGIDYIHFIEAGYQELEDQSFNRAVDWFKIASSLNPDQALSSYGEAQVYVEQGMWGNAIQAYQEAIQINPENRDYWFETGQMFEEMKAWDSALDAYKSGLNKTQGNIGLSDLHYSLARIWQQNILPIDLEKAEEAYEMALFYDDFSTELDQKAATHHQLGVIYSDSGREYDAIREFQAGLELNPNAYWTQFQLARVFQEVGELDHSKESARKAIAVNPDIKNAYQLLGDIYYSEGYPEIAFDLYLKVVEIDPEDDKARSMLESIKNSIP